MTQVLTALALIWLIAGLSILVRWLAFKKMDSWALEVSFASLIYNIIYGVLHSDSIETFCRNELFRCTVLLMFSLAISGVHLHYLAICREKCRWHFQQAINILLIQADKAGIRFRKTAYGYDYDDDDEKSGMTFDSVYAKMTPEERFRLEDQKQAYLSKIMILNETERLMQMSVSVCYSIFIDAFSYNHRGFLRRMKKKDGGASKGFRPKKTGVRLALANVINNLHIDGMPTLHEDDFNISLNEQKIGLIMFDVFEILALLLGCRLF